MNHNCYHLCIGICQKRSLCELYHQKAENFTRPYQGNWGEVAPPLPKEIAQIKTDAEQLCCLREKAPAERITFKR